MEEIDMLNDMLNTPKPKDTISSAHKQNEGNNGFANEGNITNANNNNPYNSNLNNTTKLSNNKKREENA